MKIVEAIKAYYDLHGEYPTIEQIQDLTGIRSYNTLSRHLLKLKQEGAIAWENHQSANISLI